MKATALASRLIASVRTAFASPLRFISTPGVLAAAALASLGSQTLKAQTFTSYCDPGTYTIGTLKIHNWESASSNPANWSCSTMYNGNQSINFEWNVSNYGFVNRFGYRGVERYVSTLNNGTHATYTLKLSGSTGGGLAGMYGWFWNDPGKPNTEFYIIENYFGFASNPQSGNATYIGDYTVDGGTYRIYYRPQGSNASTQPVQWWSVRTQTRSSGKISYVLHMKHWASLINSQRPAATKLGEVGLFAEPKFGSASAGKADYTTFYFTPTPL